MQRSTHSLVTQPPVSNLDTDRVVVLHSRKQPRELMSIEPKVEDYPLLVTKVHPNREVGFLHP